jgi:Ricin-type beta-trefoil lectin domain-like
MKTIQALVLLGMVTLVHPAGALTWSLAGGNENWPVDIRNQIINSMNEAVAIYNANGFFDKHVTANYNPGVPTAQAGYSGWIDFGGHRHTRVALHEICHTLGVGTYWSWNGNAFNRANALLKLYHGQGAWIGADGAHFWPYGLNYDNEDFGLARLRMCRMVAALRFDMGIVGDSDGDGMADDWEIFNFGNLAQAGWADPDGDGVSNFDEYTTDTDPNVGLVKANHTYRFTARHSGKVFDVDGARTIDGANVHQWQWVGVDAQKWTAYHLGGGWWKVVNVNSGKVLELAGMSTADGGNVQQWSWVNNYGQQWRFADSGVSGYVSLYNRNSGKVVEVYGISTANAANVVQWGDWRGDNQRWAPTEVLPLTNNTVYSLTTMLSNKVASVESPNTADGANVAQRTWNAGNWQKWRAIDLGGGFVRFMNVHSGKALGVFNSSTVNGGNVNQWAWLGGNNQQWRLEGTDTPGVYKVVNRHSGLVLDVWGASTADGANVHQWQWVGVNGQKWRFDPR